MLAFAGLPRAHRQKIRSANPLERINKEIERRSRVVGIFPNAAAHRAVAPAWTASTGRSPCPDNAHRAVAPARTTLAARRGTHVVTELADARLATAESTLGKTVNPRQNNAKAQPKLHHSKGPP